ncbi:MAG: hypothetical protein WBM71_08595, partial [Sedimenticolaceae bacterium]
SHPGGQDHTLDPHRHRHHGHLPLRSLLVGMVHGMAGSAALVVFALATVQSVWEGLAYIAIFGVGSVVGMTVLAIVISLPLRWSASSLTWAHNGLTAVLGVFTFALGILLLEQTIQALIQGATQI